MVPGATRIDALHPDGLFGSGVTVTGGFTVVTWLEGWKLACHLYGPPVVGQLVVHGRKITFMVLVVELYQLLLAEFPVRTTSGVVSSILL